MKKYRVLKTYTPDDPHSEHERDSVEFESDSTDIQFLSLAAWEACLLRTVGGDKSKIAQANVLQMMKDSDVAGQVADQETSGFEFLLFGNSGEWCLKVEEVS